MIYNFSRYATSFFDWSILYTIYVCCLAYLRSRRSCCLQGILDVDGIRCYNYPRAAKIGSFRVRCIPTDERLCGCRELRMQSFLRQSKNAWGGETVRMGWRVLRKVSLLIGKIYWLIHIAVTKWCVPGKFPWDVSTEVLVQDFSKRPETPRQKAFVGVLELGLGMVDFWRLVSFCWHLNLHRNTWEFGEFLSCTMMRWLVASILQQFCGRLIFLLWVSGYERPVDSDASWAVAPDLVSGCKGAQLPTKVYTHCLLEFIVYSISSRS